MKVIITSKKFKRGLKRLDENATIALKKRLVIFTEREFDPILNNHKLNGRYLDCRSINITSDYRLIYEKINESTYHFLAIGSHSDLYS